MGGLFLNAGSSTHVFASKNQSVIFVTYLSITYFHFQFPFMPRLNVN